MKANIEREMVKNMMKQNELRFARKGFMKNVVMDQEEFARKQDEIITEIIQNASPNRQERICKIYGSMNNYETVLKKLTDLEVDVQKGLLEMMMSNLELGNEVKATILEQMYGVANVCYEEAEYIDEDDDYEYEDEDECYDDEDEYVDDDEDEEDYEYEEDECYDDEDEYVDDDEDYEYEDEDECYDDEDEYVDDDEDEYVDDDEDYEYEDEDEYYDDDDEEYDAEEEAYLECLECYLFEEDEEYEMPAFQERLSGVRQILEECGEFSEAEETKLCLDMGTVLDMPGSTNIEGLKEIPIEFSFEMKSLAIAICKKYENFPAESRSTKVKSKALVEEIVKRVEKDPSNTELLDELIEKASEYQLQRLFLNFEK